MLIEDGRLTDLLSETDAQSDQNPRAAAQNLREIILPRAQRNREAAGRISPQHPRAQQLARELQRLSDERVATIELYARALDTADLVAQRDAVRRQIALEQGVHRLQDDLERAERAPRESGCAAW